MLNEFYIETGSMKMKEINDEIHLYLWITNIFNDKTAHCDPELSHWLFCNIRNCMEKKSTEIQISTKIGIKSGSSYWWTMKKFPNRF